MGAQQLIQVEQPDVPQGPGQFSSTVCVYAEQGAEATICASAYQELAGDRVPWWVWAIVVVAVLLVAGAAVVFWRRARGRGQSEA